jgi:predicted small lipoprotein YifL
MKTLLPAICLSLLALTGCGTPDPLLYTSDSKGRSQTKSDQQEQQQTSEEHHSTQWQSKGTHEVEQK